MFNRAWKQLTTQVCLPSAPFSTAQTLCAVVRFWSFRVAFFWICWGEKLDVH
jgi:hypothetical protein